ncbi:MAG: hypothetical protein V4438_03255 [Patescibacteria group bacterium]
MNVHSRLYKHTRATREMVAQMLQRLAKRERELFLQMKAEIEAAPLVEVSQQKIADLDITVLTAKRRGLLVDMIRAGVSANLPKLSWASSVSYVEPHSTVAGEAFMFEEVFASGLSLADHTLPTAIPQRMIEAGLGQDAAHHFDEEDRATRVSDVFVSPELLQFRAGKLSRTLFMSEFGPGTRIFLLAA